MQQRTVTIAAWDPILGNNDNQLAIVQGKTGNPAYPEFWLHQVRFARVSKTNKAVMAIQFAGYKGGPGEREHWRDYTQIHKDITPDITDTLVGYAALNGLNLMVSGRPSYWLEVTLHPGEQFGDRSIGLVWQLCKSLKISDSWLANFDMWQKTEVLLDQHEPESWVLRSSTLLSEHHIRTNLDWRGSIPDPLAY
jgi:hypothetical protein